MRYEVSTRVLDSLRIEQTVDMVAQHDYLDSHESVRDTLIRMVVNTADEGIRHALMQLGWTPPPEKS